MCYVILLINRYQWFHGINILIEPVSVVTLLLNQWHTFSIESTLFKLTYSQAKQTSKLYVINKLALKQWQPSISTENSSNSLLKDQTNSLSLLIWTSLQLHIRIIHEHFEPVQFIWTKKQACEALYHPLSQLTFLHHSTTDCYTCKSLLIHYLCYTYIWYSLLHIYLI